MKKASCLSFLALAAMLGAGSVHACGDAAEQVHVGKIAQLDARKNIFTLSDMETGKTLTFVASSELLVKLATTTRPVAVKYSVNGDQMMAMSVQ